MSFGFSPAPAWRAPAMPFRRIAPVPAPAPAWHQPLPVRSVNPMAAIAAQRQLELQHQLELKRQNDLLRMRERDTRRWQGRPPGAPVTNNYYNTPAPTAAPLAPVPDPIVTSAPQTPVYVPPSMPAPQPDVSPGNATQDLSPTQDAAAAANTPPVEEHPGHGIARKIVIGLVVVGAGVGGYMLFKKHKSAPKAHHGMQGFRRRRRR